MTLCLHVVVAAAAAAFVCDLTVLQGGPNHICAMRFAGVRGLRFLSGSSEVPYATIGVGAHMVWSKHKSNKHKFFSP